MAAFETCEFDLVTVKSAGMVTGDTICRWEAHRLTDTGREMIYQSESINLGRYHREAPKDWGVVIHNPYDATGGETYQQMIDDLILDGWEADKKNKKGILIGLKRKLIDEAVPLPGIASKAENPPDSSPTENTPITKSSGFWEYRVISQESINYLGGNAQVYPTTDAWSGSEWTWTDDSDLQDTVEERLNKLGREGWELAQVIAAPNLKTFYLKRNIRAARSKNRRTNS